MRSFIDYLQEKTVKEPSIVNKTPHPIILLSSSGEILKEYPVEGSPVRLSSKVISDDPIGDIPTTRTVFGAPEGLPSASENTYYIVSQLVKSALPNRSDLLVPSEVVRDSSGNIIGCKSFGR
jgi:hypothetical protein